MQLTEVVSRKALIKKWKTKRYGARDLNSVISLKYESACMSALIMGEGAETNTIVITS